MGALRERRRSTGTRRATTSRTSVTTATAVWGSSLIPTRAVASALNQSAPGAGDSFAYDALGRTTTVTHSDGTSSTATYAFRATQITDEGNGSRGVSRILQKDGLGRLASACEVSSTTLVVGTGKIPGACNMDTRRWFLALSGAALAARHNLWVGGHCAVESGSHPARVSDLEHAPLRRQQGRDRVM